jgi:WD40 repeat protein
MSSDLSTLPSVIERTARFSAGARIAAIHPFGEAPLFVLDDEALLVGTGAGERIELSEGVVLSSIAAGERVIAGTDAGHIIEVKPGAAPARLHTDPRRRWIDKVALGPDGVVAWGAGKAAHVKMRSGKIETLDLPSSVGGLAFMPKGLRLAIARYNGASLWFPGTAAKPEELEWKGSHLGIVLSPDGKFVITTMQEPQLHGWKLPEVKHMRMSGYPGRVTSMGFTADGKWLATSGADMVILWPFQSKDGPMGKQPRMVAPYDKRVTAVACHPRQEVIACGYQDGLLLMVRLSDGAEILARKPDQTAISALAWVRDGASLAYGTEAGEAARIDL